MAVRYLNEATWIDANWSALEAAIRYSQQSLQIAQGTLSHNRAWRDRITEKLKALRADLDEHRLTPTQTTTQDELGLQTVVNGIIWDCQNSIDRRITAACTAADDAARRVDQIRDELARNKERLAAYPEGYTGGNTVTRAELIEQLTGLPNIKPGGIAIIDDDGPTVTWIIEDVYLSPDAYPPWISTPHEAPSFKLQSIKASIRLWDGLVKLAPLRGQRPQAPFNWEGKRVHPHVLAGDIPCLGDFTGPIREATHLKDFNTAATLIRLFLERAFTADSAGRNWIKLPERVVGEILETQYGNSACITACNRGLLEVDVDNERRWPILRENATEKGRYTLDF